MVVMVLVAGCTAGEAGAPDPGTASSASRAPAVPHPTVSRPAELSLAGVDPCELLTDPQLDQLKVNSRPRSSEDGRDGRTCSLDVDLTAPYYSYYVETITTADLREWTEGERAKPTATTTEPTAVAGFPAIIRHADGSTPSDCETYVGVAEGQTLRTQVVPTAPDDFTQAELCELAVTAAGFATKTLQSTR